jgi:hypothetical protein
MLAIAAKAHYFSIEQGLLDPPTVDSSSPGFLEQASHKSHPALHSRADRQSCHSRMQASNPIRLRGRAWNVETLFSSK